MTLSNAARPHACIWCWKPIDHSDDGASFLFLAKTPKGFAPSDRYLDESPHIEGHQFFCHVRCFRESVPEAMQYGLELALDLP